jgi:hypothetical protein
VWLSPKIYTCCNDLLVRPPVTSVPTRILDINRSVSPIFLVTRFFWLAFSWRSLPSVSRVFFCSEIAAIVHHPLVESAIDYYFIKCSSGGDLEEPLVRILHDGGGKVIGTEGSFRR